MVTHTTSLCTRPSQPASSSIFMPRWQDSAQSLAKLGRGKAVGPDMIPAELIHAGGNAFAVPSFCIYEELVCKESWPVQRKGGRISDLFKDKGSAHDCENSRGLLVSDHMSKAAVDLIKDQFVDAFEAGLAENQSGGVSAGGTDFANHIVRSIIH